MKFRLPQVYFSKIMRAIVEFDLIRRGDRILIGLSGGKDSLLLTYALAMMRERTRGAFELAAFTVDPMFGASFDADALARFCASLDIPHETRRVDIAGIIRESPKDAPCFTCSFFRRGAVNRYALERGCGTVAYAHHNDDAVETLLMNLLCSGQISTFLPKTYLDRSGLTVIRPLVYLREAETRDAIQYHGMMPAAALCPFDGHTTRQDIKTLVASLERKNPPVYARLAAALRESSLGELWPRAKTRPEMKAAYDRFLYGR